MAAKLVVTARKGGSQIALVGASGAELLASKVFSEPRAKGATLRSLKALMGDDIVVEDHTLSTPGRSAATRNASNNSASTNSASTNSASTNSASTNSAATRRVATRKARKASAPKSSVRKAVKRNSKPPVKRARSTARRARATAK
ncbi:MAG TPA: hypothetical protein VLX59_05720 [Acidimicrobiales bacterium]|nr:hypothetical protein [Acidimicrobiales bacterium]